MIGRNTGIRTSLLLLFLLHLTVCPAFHEYQDFKETEIFHFTSFLENSHHDHPMVYREKQLHIFDLLNGSFYMKPPAGGNPFQKATNDFFSSLSPDPKTPILRC